MRVYHSRGRLIGESQERVARAIRLRRMPGDVGVSPTSPFSWPGEGGQVEDYARRGDEVEQLVDVASIGWKSPLDRLLRDPNGDLTYPVHGHGGETYTQI